MRKHMVLAAGAALLMGTAGAAANGDSEYIPPEPPPQAGSSPEYRPPQPPQPADDGHDWSGPYAGVQGGWLWGEDEAWELGPEDDGPLPYDTDGYAVGGVLGINLQTGNWVYGVEFDVEYADLSGRWTWDSGNVLNKNIDILGSLRPRVGFAFDRFMVYGTGGLAVGHVHMEAVDIETPESIEGNETAFGYTYGGGVAVELWGNWSAGAEYRYTDLGRSEHRGDIFNGDFDFDFTYPHTNRFHAVRARLIYRMPI